MRQCGMPRTESRPAGGEKIFQDPAFIELTMHLYLPQYLVLTHFILQKDNFLLLIEVQLIYSFELISAVQQTDSVIHIYTFFFVFFSIIVYHRILNIVICDIQWISFLQKHKMESHISHCHPHIFEQSILAIFSVSNRSTSFL